jgi:hypothetical protein
MVLQNQPASVGLAATRAMCATSNDIQTFARRQTPEPIRGLGAPVPAVEDSALYHSQPRRVLSAIDSVRLAGPSRDCCIANLIAAPSLGFVKRLVGNLNEGFRLLGRLGNQCCTAN